jgi:hypothetical protein
MKIFLGWRDIHDFNDYNAAAEAEQIAVSDQVYRCYRCRKSLFARSHLIEHKSLSDDPCTFGYLLEPLKWMKFEDNQPSGKVQVGTIVVYIFTDILSKLQ